MNGTNGLEPILVVDDDEAILEVVQAALEMEGYGVVLARDGKEALEILRQRTPRLILLDMRMPRMNGWEFAEAYRGLGRRSPIVVMTAGHDAAAKCSEIGAAGYIGKPFDLDDLVSVVGAHVA